MKITELLKELKETKEKYGDLNIQYINQAGVFSLDNIEVKEYKQNGQVQNTYLELEAYY